ncbi:hypothetical protein JOE21_003688, partial [Desmospora profundinema]|nr:hypothetical protein [Desmospora profundinema]
AEGVLSGPIVLAFNHVVYPYPHHNIYLIILK